MACANTERDAWCAAGGNSACRDQCGKCSDSQKACFQEAPALAQCGDYVIVDRFDGSFWGQRSAMGYAYHQRNAANMNELLTWSASNNVDWGWKEGSNYGQLFYKESNGGTTPAFAASVDAWTADRVDCTAADACQGGGRCSFVKRSVLLSHASWANTKARATVAAQAPAQSAFQQLDLTNHAAVQAAKNANMFTATRQATSASDCQAGERYFYCQQVGSSTDNYDYCGDNAKCPVNSVHSSACCYCGGCLAEAR